MLAAFAIVYALVIEGAENLLKESSNNRAVAFSLSRTFMLSPLGRAIRPLRELGIPGKAVYGLMALTLGSVEMIGPLFLVFAGESLKDGARMAIGKEMLPDDALTDILAGWIGIGGFWFLTQEGLSQMYFLFVAILFVSKYCLHAAGRLQGRLAVNNRIYEAMGSDFGEAVREAGVDYIVVTRRLAEAAGGLEGAVKPVFSNEDIDIYEVAVQPD